jgi:hypothetical protein
VSAKRYNKPLEKSVIMNKIGDMEPTVIHNFYKATQSLREAMESDLPLNDLERISLENYIALLQMTYIEWKRRNCHPPAYRKAA